MRSPASRSGRSSSLPRPARSVSNLEKSSPARRTPRSVPGDPRASVVGAGLCATVAGCPGPDSNRDALRHCPLKTACLPVPPPGRVAKARTPPGRNQAEHLASGASGDSLHRMELWVAFAFGAAVGAFIGVLLGRYRATAAAGRLAAARAPAPPPPPVQHVVLDEGSANVLNALN